MDNETLKRNVIVVTGLSGAGRSSAGDVLEDMGFRVIDNLPGNLISPIVSLATGKRESEDSNVALVLGRGESDFHKTILLLHELREKNQIFIIFLEAADEILIRRFEATRRRHPMIEQGTLVDAIRLEKQLLAPIAELADEIIDTSEMTVHELREYLHGIFASESRRMTVTVQSFGFGSGIPLDSEFVFDVRFLPNPYWVDNLRDLDGNDQRVANYVLESREAQRYLDEIVQMLGGVLPIYEKEGKNNVVVSIGCTGGQHRSVAMSNALANKLKHLGFGTRIFHRDLKNLSF